METMERKQPRQLDMIMLLAGSGAIVVCAGGGGIPVVRRLGDAEALLDGKAGTIVTPASARFGATGERAHQRTAPAAEELTLAGGADRPSRQRGRK